MRICRQVVLDQQNLFLLIFAKIMIYDIVISDQAETDLREIFEYIAFELQAQMAELFQSSRTNIVEHIRNIYEEGELDEDSTCRNFRQVRTV